MFRKRKRSWIATKFIGFYINDFNWRSTNWWENDIENDEGKLFESHTADLGLHKLINEPTHLIRNSRSCNDLIFTDQPNQFLEILCPPFFTRELSSPDYLW